MLANSKTDEAPSVIKTNADWIRKNMVKEAVK